MFIMWFLILLPLTHAFLLDDLPGPGVSCYNCGDGGPEHFPLCLDTPVKCRVGEVCRIKHGNRTNAHGPQINCVAGNRCSRDLINHQTPCPAGGVSLRDGLCEACCTDNTCVADMTNYLNLEMMSSQNLFCPGHCDVSNPQECVDTGRVCNELDFCQVTIDHHKKIYGQCKDDHLWNNCLQELEQTPCPQKNFANPFAYTHDASNYCYHSCCVTNECLYNNFGIHMANSVVHRNPKVPPTHNTLWSQIHGGSCADVFDNKMCSSLKNDHRICKNRLNISSCLNTCGVCSNIHDSTCVDVSTNCSSVQPNYCHTPEAVFDCPRKCNLCDKLIDSIITSVVEGNIRATLAPSQIINCSDFDKFHCDYLGPMCSETFLSVICPDMCQPCSVH